MLDDVSVEATSAEEVLSFLEGVFEQSDPFVDEVSVADVTRAAAARLAGGAPERPRVRARLAWVLGRTLAQLELPDEAEPLLEEARRLREAQYGDDSPEVAEALRHLASLRLARLRPEDAEGLLLRALDMQRAHGVTGEELGETHFALSDALAAQGRLADAETHLERAFAQFLTACGPKDPAVLRARLGVAALSWHRGELQEAERGFREVLAAVAEVAAPLVRIQCELGLGLLPESQMRTQEAIEHLRSAQREARSEFGPHTHLFRRVSAELASALAANGGSDEVVALRREVLAALLRAEGGTKALTQDARLDLADALREAGERAEAEELLREVEAALPGLPEPDEIARRLAEMQR